MTALLSVRGFSIEMLTRTGVRPIVSDLTFEIAPNQTLAIIGTMIFTFPYALDDPRYLFLISTPEGLRRWPVPKVGGRGIVPFARLPTEGDSPTLPPPPPGAR